MKILWILNMVMPDAAKELGIRTSFSGSWMIDPLTQLAMDPTLEIATMTYGSVEKLTIVDVNNVKHYIFPGSGKRLLFYSSQTDEDCRYVLNDFQPELIHIYGTEYAMGYSISKMQLNIPVLLTIQGILTYISKAYRGGLPGRTYHSLMTFKQLLRMKTPLFSELLFRKNAKRERETLSQIQYVTGRTSHDKAFVLSANPNAKYFRLNYNLREAFYKAEKWSYEDCRKFTIFTGAATYPLKGLHMLLEAVALVKKKYPQVTLVVPGNNTSYKNSNGYERYLRRRIKALDLCDNVQYVGRRTEEEMIRHLQSAHVYVLPSAYDTDSLSLCEAQFIGTPCITSMRGGSGDLVQDRVSGFCYEYSDYSLMAERICQLFESEELCEKLSSDAIRQASLRHDRLQNVKQQRRLYDELAEEQRR